MNRKERRKEKALALQNDSVKAMNDAYNFHSKGQLDKAERMYKEIIKIYPNHFDALRHLGILYQDRRELDIAHKFFLKAYKILPKNPSIYNNLGSINFQKFKFKESFDLFKTCLSLEPDFIPALNNIALLCHRINHAEDALYYSSKALKLSSSILTKTNYALALSINNQLEEAIIIFKELAKEDPSNSNYKNLGTAYKDSGDLKKSYDSYIKALEKLPGDPAAFFNLCGSRHYKPEKSRTELFEKTILDNNNLDSNEKTAICFGLYKTFHKLKDYNKSAKYLHLGNQYSDVWLKNEIENEVFLIDEIINIFNQEFIKKNTLDVPLKKNPIFILGMPRSGTTLCEQIISTHSEVFGAGELPYIIRLSGIKSAYNLSNDQVKEFKERMTKSKHDVFRKMCDDYINKLEEIDCGSNYITDKMPHNFVMLGLIKMIMPTAKIIYCKRDAMDNCFSLYSHNFTDTNHGYSYNQTKLGKYYNLHNKLMKHWISIFKKDIFVLEHEELINNQEIISKEMLSYCGLKWEKQCLEFYENNRQVQTASNEQVRQPINKKSLDAWKKYEPHLEDLRKSLGI